jgi:hypothetical protein
MIVSVPGSAVHQWTQATGAKIVPGFAAQTESQAITVSALERVGGLVLSEALGTFWSAG